MPRHSQRRRLALTAAMYALAVFGMAAFVGWQYAIENPNGALLYTPGPNAPANYTPAFSIGFAVALGAVLVLATLIGLATALTLGIRRLLGAVSPSAKTVMHHMAVMATLTPHPRPRTTMKSGMLITVLAISAAPTTIMAVQPAPLRDAQQTENAGSAGAPRVEPSKIVDDNLLSPPAHETHTVLANAMPGLAGCKIAPSSAFAVDLWFQQQFSHQGKEYLVGFVKLREIDPKTNAPNTFFFAKPLIGAVTYTLADNQWQVLSRQAQPILKAGIQGDAPAPLSVRQIALGVDTALLVPGTIKLMGIIGSHEDVLAFNGTTWSFLGGITTGKEDECAKSEGVIQVITGTGAPNRPDLLVESTGAIGLNAGNGPCRPAPASNERYRFDGSTYERVGAPGRLTPRG